MEKCGGKVWRKSVTEKYDGKVWRKSVAENSLSWSRRWWPKMQSMRKSSECPVHGSWEITRKIGKMSLQWLMNIWETTENQLKNWEIMRNNWETKLLRNWVTNICLFTSPVCVGLILISPLHQKSKPVVWGGTLSRQLGEMSSSDGNRVKTQVVTPTVTISVEFDSPVPPLSGHQETGKRPRRQSIGDPSMHYRNDSAPTL